SDEHDTSKLLEMILTKSREITNSDAGSLYLVEEAETENKKTSVLEEIPSAAVSGGSKELAPAAKLIKASEGKKRLRFKLLQNDTVNIPFRELTMDINDKSIAVYVALTGSTVH